MSLATSSTLLRPRSKTLIDNTFSTDTNKEVISDNILPSISDHLAQLLLFPTSRHNSDKKKEIYKRSFKHFEAENVQNDVQNIDWDRALKIDKKLEKIFFGKFFNIFELLLDTHALLKRVLIAELKKTSIRTKGHLYKRILRTKNRR